MPRIFLEIFIITLIIRYLCSQGYKQAVETRNRYTLSHFNYIELTFGFYDNVFISTCLCILVLRMIPEKRPKKEDLTDTFINVLFLFARIL